MTPRELLQLEVSLLLVRHGRSAVLTALAARLDESEEQLVRRLEGLRSERVEGPKKKKSVARAFDIDAFTAMHPSKREDLKTLYARYQNRTFLPELKDVKRFFERHGTPSPAAKSRVLVTQQLFERLASLREQDLHQLCDEPAHDPGTSSLGLISDEILRRRR